MTVIEALRKYFKQFPRLQEERLDMNCLQSKTDSYSIDSVPGESVLTRYLDGSTVRRCLFTISGRMYHSADLKNQNSNMAFFEDLEAWIERKTLFMHLPELGEKRKARSLEVTLSGYPYLLDENGETARYQIQCRLTYLQEV